MDVILIGCSHLVTYFNIRIYFKSSSDQMMPTQSMPQKGNHDSQERYSYVYVGTLVSVDIIDILTKNSFFVMRQRRRIRKRVIMT